MKVSEALRHPKVLMLASAYFLTTSANYGIEFFCRVFCKSGTR